MDRSIREVFEDECGHLVANSAFVKRLHDYQVGFVNKNSDHIDFFGGYLTGVQTVRFTDADRDRWFTEILECDETQLGDRLIKLPDVNPEFNVSSDAMNLSCAWLLHFFFHGTKLSSKEKEQAMVDVLLVWQYKYLTSRLYRHFQYPADKAVAEAAYVSLSGKFDLKRYGSWGATLHARAERIIEPSSIYHHTIDKMDNDKLVVRMVNDIQGKIREMLKLLYRAFLDAHQHDKRIVSTNSVVEFDGLEILKDKTKTYRAYLQYIYSVVTDEGSFIKEELLVVIEKMMHTMPPRLFRETLVWMSKNYRQAHASEIEKILHDTLIHCFGYLNDNRSLVKSHSDLPAILGNLKGVYASSRSSDPALIALRDLTEKMVKKATNNRNSTVLAAVRSGVMLYIVARAMTMRHYSESLTV